MWLWCNLSPLIRMIYISKQVASLLVVLRSVFNSSKISSDIYHRRRSLSNVMPTRCDITDGQEVLNTSRSFAADHTLNQAFKWSLEQKHRLCSAEPAALLRWGQVGGQGSKVSWQQDEPHPVFTTILLYTSLSSSLFCFNMKRKMKLLEKTENYGAVSTDWQNKQHEHDAVVLLSSFIWNILVCKRQEKPQTLTGFWVQVLGRTRL